mgnify:CR=1 FL=1
MVVGSFRTTAALRKAGSADRQTNHVPIMIMISNLANLQLLQRGKRREPVEVRSSAESTRPVRASPSRGVRHAGDAEVRELASPEEAHEAEAVMAPAPKQNLRFPPTTLFKSLLLPYQLKKKIMSTPSSLTHHTLTTNKIVKN